MIALLRSHFPATRLLLRLYLSHNTWSWIEEEIFDYAIKEYWVSFRLLFGITLEKEIK